jgi:hypothetical protein
MYNFFIGPHRVQRGLALIVCLVAGLFAGLTIAAAAGSHFQTAAKSTAHDAALIAITGASEAQADTSPQTYPTADGIVYKTFTGQDFYAAAQKDMKVANFGNGLVAVVPGTTTDDHFLTLRLDLPQGARITEVVFYYVHGAKEKIEFNLVRYNPLAATAESLATLMAGEKDPVGADVQVKALTADFENPLAVVDNTAYEYSLQFFPSPGSRKHSDGLRLAGARVGYTLPTVYLPAVNRSN